MVGILKVILDILLFVAKWGAIIASPFILVMCFHFVRLYKQGKRIKRRTNHYKKRSIIKRLLFDFPKQFVEDLFNKDPEAFEEYGFNIITGKQGSGKTLTLVYLLLKLKKEYPKLIIKTNMAYKHEDGVISHWSDLMSFTNGIYGEIDVLDEVQNWFSCAQSKDFPPEMLNVVTQQRKKRKMILGTSQVFARVAKPLRENTYMLYKPLTIFGCITIVRKVEPILEADGNVAKEVNKGMFFFVHSKEIRQAYDTFKTIDGMKKSGFIASPFKNSDTKINVEIK